MISFTPGAEADLQAVFEYIAAEDAAAAGRVVARILQAIQMLENFPQIGRVGRVAGTRELHIVGLHYFAVYRSIGGDDLEIIAVVHDRQRFPPRA
jgi:toxin ParE1/3/4